MRGKFLIGFNILLLIGFFALKDKWLIPTNSTPLVYGQLAPFHLIDQDGREVTLDTFKGRVWVMNFMFSRCPSQCPAMNFKMSLLQKIVPSGVFLASLSVDPDYDTPDTLRDYAKQFNPGKDRWIFLTGDKAEIGKILKSAHLGDSGEPSMHSLRFILIDKNGAIRGYYNSEEEEPLKKIKKDAQFLL